MSSWIADRFRRASNELHRAREKVEECKKAITTNRVPPHVQECEKAINYASLLAADLLKEYSTSVYLDYTLDRMASNATISDDMKDIFRGMRNEVKNKNENKRLEKIKRMIYKMGFNFNMARKAKTEQQAVALLDEVIDSAGNLAELCDIAADYVLKDNEPIEELKNGVSLDQISLGGYKRTHRKRKNKRTHRKGGAEGEENNVRAVSNETVKQLAKIDEQIRVVEAMKKMVDQLHEVAQVCHGDNWRQCVYDKTGVPMNRIMAQSLSDAISVYSKSYAAEEAKQERLISELPENEKKTVMNKLAFKNTVAPKRSRHYVFHGGKTRGHKRSHRNKRTHRKRSGHKRSGHNRKRSIRK